MSSKKLRTVYHQPSRIAPYKVSQWTPMFKGAFLWAMAYRVYHTVWRRGLGLYVTSSTRRGVPGDVPTYYHKLPPVLTVKRRDKLVSASSPLPSALAASIVMSKMPMIREWCTATNYEDGTVRVPGAFRMATRGTLWALTVTDPDSSSRVTVVHQELDVAIKMMEAALASPECPWEPDPFAKKGDAKKSGK